MDSVYNISSTNNEFLKCAVGEYGGVFYLYKSPFYDYNSLFEENSGVVGVILCENCTMNLQYT